MELDSGPSNEINETDQCSDKISVLRTTSESKESPEIDVFLIPDIPDTKTNKEKTKDGNEFLVPAVPAHTFTKPQTVQIIDDKEITVQSNNSNIKQTDNSCNDSNENENKEGARESNQVELHYKVPTWGGPPDEMTKYSLTVLKDGVVKNNVDLSGKSMLTFGRLDECDVVVEHPSCSRFHALLQYCIIEEGKRKKGYYLFDLGSTHGTYLNKEKLKTKVYTRIRVGYQLKFGGSSRLYIVEGPEEDQEEEIDLDVIREKRRQYEQQRMEEKQKQSNKINKIRTTSNLSNTSNENNNESDEDEGATWGFGEDAKEDGLDLKELFERKKDIEIKDPKKTLRGFFEREGIEFDYELSERGTGNRITHIAQVRLPIDTTDAGEVIAEGSSTNKRDAVLACATEACRLIQAYDMMQNTCREDQRLKRQRELEENDFYDSDEDSYLDRTGSIEKKRLKRKYRAGKKKETGRVETHDSLKEKLQSAEKELYTLEKKMQLAKAAETLSSDADSLDAYMSSMKHRLDNPTKQKIKRNISELGKEVTRLKNLVEKTKPVELPKLMTQVAVASKVAQEATFNQSVPPLRKQNENLSTTPSLDVSSKSTSKTAIIDTSEKLDEKNKDMKPLVKKKKKKRVYSAPMKSADTNQGVRKQDKEFVEWLPPENQTGDGRTGLNDKFGY